MACIYELKGHRFNSELELDDFLLSNGHLISKLGDIVFDNTAAMNESLAELQKIKEAGELAAQRHSKYRQAVRYHDGIKEEPYKSPYIGVTQFLSGLKNEKGLMFPEFIAEEYWGRRLGKWSESLDNMTDEEKELFSKMYDGNPPSSITPEKANELRTLIENKWDQQGVIGSCVHKVIELYFSKGLNIGKGFNLIVRKELEQFIDKEINSNARKLEGKRVYTLDEIIPKNSTMINDAIEIARKLKDSLESTFGSDLRYFPEFKLTAKLTQEVKEANELIGTIDLVVLDNKGNVHVVDFKTSPKNYNSATEYSAVKKNVIRHQLAAYSRMLAYNGLNKPENRMLVVPIQIENFKPLDNEMYTYTGLKENISNTIFDDLTNQINKAEQNSASNNISIYIDVPYVGVFSEDKVLETVKDQFEKWIPNYKKADTDLTDEEIKEEIEKYGGFTPDEDGNLVYKVPRSEMVPITVKASNPNAKAALFKKVKEYKIKMRDSAYNATTSIKQELVKCCADPNRSPEFPEQKNYGVSKAWFEQNVKQYRNGFWEVLDDDKFKFLDSFGIIALRNKVNGRVDFIKISLNNINWRYDFGKGRSILTGAFETDVQQKSKQGTLILESVRGNIELMETMLVINQMIDLFNGGCTVGQVMVANPLYGIGVQASNEELLYNFQELCKHSPLDVNNFDNGRIKLLTKLQLVNDDLERITHQGISSKWQNCAEFKRLFDAGSLSRLIDDKDWSIEEKIKALDELRRDLEENGPYSKKSLLKNANYQLDDIYDDYTQLYNNILIAIADLKGVSFRQQIRDHDKWFQSARLLTKGLSGTYIDNPGNLTSDTLNLVTKMVTEAYQNVRIEMQEPVQKFNYLVDNLIKEKNYGIVGKRFFENQTNLYNNLFNKAYKDDLVLKKIDDPSLSKAEKEFLIYFLEEVNRKRFPNEPISKLEEWRDSGDIRYYRVPIKLGDKGSKNVARNAKIEEEGLAAYLKSSIQPWKLSNIKKKILQEADELLSDSAENERLISDKELFNLGSRFEKGDGSERLDLIESIGFENLERNLETLGIDYLFNQSVRENINEVFPMIKAAHIHLSMQGANQNLEKGFKQDIEYIDNYIKSVIKGESILDEKQKKIQKPLSVIKRAASFCTLAFSPVQALYQTLQGFWNDISLMIRRPDGTQAFTPQNMSKAFVTVYKDLTNPTGKPSICSRLNELYGLNDMDMNSLVDRLKSDQGGFLHLNNFFMKFATRPDYYNRLTIFGAQMRADGCWDAHSLSEEGLLQYDWTKDQRFDLFAKYKNNPQGLSGTQLEKYNQQKGLYVTMAQQFMKENATVGTGKNKHKFQLDINNPMPLPRAYTTLQSESMKEIADNIYGYYSHEKKSLIHATLIGSMWMQFRTYWSGKKNQYLGTGGIKLRGRWQKQEGLFYNENGDIVKEDTGVPVYMWEGDWQEGIVATMSDLVKGWADVGLKESIKDKWFNEDEKLRLIYRNNIKQLGIDLTMFLVGGLLITGLLADWLKDFEKEKKEEDDLTSRIQLAAAKIAVQSVRTSFVDFNFFNSIGDPLASWTPFAAEWAGRTINNTWRIITGNEDLWDGALNIFSAGKQIKPALATIKPSMFKTESEGGTFIPRNQRKKEND